MTADGQGGSIMKKFAVIASALAALAFSASSVFAADKVSFGTDWKAQAEHGGFYQALAEGLYAKRGLDVKIIQGGPDVNVPQLLAGGAARYITAQTTAISITTDNRLCHRKIV